MIDSDAVVPPRLEEIEELVHQLEGVADESTRNAAMELVQLIMELHRSGLEQLIDIVTQEIAPEEGALLRLADDEVVSGLLLLHGLHPIDLATRVNQALEQVRPYLKSHGGNVELIRIEEDGTLHLKLAGSCHGCPSSAMTLKLAIESAIYEFAPDISQLVVEGVVAPQPANFIDLDSLGFASKDGAEETSMSNGTGWEEVSEISSLQDGELKIQDVSEHPILFAKAVGEFYAYETECPHCQESLEGGTLEGCVLSCPECHTQFDVIRAGRCLDIPTLHLDPVPLLESKGRIRIALAVTS